MRRLCVFMVSLAALLSFFALSGVATDSAKAGYIDGDGTYCYLDLYDCGYGYGQTSGQFIEKFYEDAADAQYGRCRTAWIGYTRNNAAGYHQWEYFQQVKWCWRNGLITYLHRDRWAQNVGWMWSFDGNIGGSCQLEHCDGATGTYSRNIYTQGAFHVCLGAFGINVCSYKYPRLYMTVMAGGTYYHSEYGN